MEERERGLRGDAVQLEGRGRALEPPFGPRDDVIVIT